MPPLELVTARTHQNVPLQLMGHQSTRTTFRLEAVIAPWDLLHSDKMARFATQQSMKLAAGHESGTSSDNTSDA